MFRKYFIDIIVFLEIFWGGVLFYGINDGRMYFYLFGFFI